MPAAGATDEAYFCVLLLTGSLISWAQAVNNAIMAEITPQHLRGTIYGLDRTFEGVLSPAGPALVGLLAERAFGFSALEACGAQAAVAELNASAPDVASASAGAGGHDALDHNASALATALAAMMVVPWTACVLAYTFMHCTYPTDRRRAASLVCGGAARSRAGGVDGPDADGVSLMRADKKPDSAARGGVKGGSSGGPTAVCADTTLSLSFRMVNHIRGARDQLYVGSVLA